MRGVKVPVVVEGRRRRKIAYAEYISGSFECTACPSSVSDTKSSMENCVEPKIDEYLENEPMELAVSSPCDQTHHGWSLGGMALKSVLSVFRYLGFSAHLGFSFWLDPLDSLSWVLFLARLTRLSTDVDSFD